MEVILEVWDIVKELLGEALEAPLIMEAMLALLLAELASPI